MILLLLIVLPALIIYVGICLPIDLFKYVKWKKNYQETLEIIPSLGYIIGVGGHVGAGKSTSVAGITTFMENYVASQAEEKLEYVQTIINKYNFTKLNNYLDSLFYDEKMQKVINGSLPLIEDYAYDDDYHITYYDGIKEHTYEDLFKDYIEAYLALKRNNFVFCNIKFDSVVTGNRAFELKGSDFKIKDRFLEKDYRLRRYSIFFYDEATLDTDKINLNWQKTGQEDSGTIEHLRLFRHYYKGKSYYFTTLQNPGRLVKAERELFNSIIMIKDKEDLEQFKRIKHIIKVANWCNETAHNFKLKLRGFFHVRYNANKRSLYKNIKRLLLVAKDRLDSKDYLRYYVDIYDTAKEADNGSRNAYSTKLILPKKWCYGPIDTYEYAYQYDAAVAESKVSPTPKLDDSMLEDKIKLATEYLAKKVKDTEKAKPKKLVDTKKVKITF